MGIHLGHDASAALIVDGEVKGAVQEERFKRIKNYSGFPDESIQFLLTNNNLVKNDIENITVAGNKIGYDIPIDLLKQRLERKKSKFQIGFYRIKILLNFILRIPQIRNFIYSNKAKEIIENSLFKKGFQKAKVFFIDHHLCHAASAFYSSPYDEAIIVTQDGRGDLKSGSTYHGHNGRLEKLYDQSAINSLGQIYAMVTKFLGFKPNRHEGKITGLAAYGNKEKYYSAFSLLVKATKPKIIRSKQDSIKNLLSGYKKFIELVGAYSNRDENFIYEINSLKIEKWLSQLSSPKEKEDISAAVQFCVEEWIVENVKDQINSAKHKFNTNKIPLCLAGGLFANVKVNQRLKENIHEIENVYVQPAMGDSGLSLGGAQCLFYNHNNSKHKFLDNVYLGPEFTSDEIIDSLEKNKSNINWEYYEKVEKKCAEIISNGHILGRFNGKMEWGPRALGNRSILIQPTDKKINDTVNKRLNRTEFMPFAPSVLDYRAGDYFINYKQSDFASEFMTITYDVYPHMINEIQAVVHVDNTARPQIVQKNVNYSFYKILKYYEELTGIGCLVNTSFNLHEEPIVNSPKDAISALLSNAIDYLAIDKYIVTKK